MYDTAACFERAERRFRADIWSCAPIDAVLEAGVQARHFGPVLATVFADLPEAPGMNLIQGAAEPGAMEGSHLAEAVEWMRSWEVEFLVPVAADRPGTVEAETWLDRLGCEQSVVVRKYFRGPGRALWPDAPGVEVRRLAPEEDEGLSVVATEGLRLPDLAGILFFGLPCLPDWQCYVAYLDGEEVACGSMLIDGEIAVLGLDATLHHARGRGCNRALLRRRLNDAARAGAKTVLALALDHPRPGPSAAAARLLDVGFLEAYRSVAWHRPAKITVA
jgi:GNAT superfamily N-acetyltransferase